jgi:hypothetical protein
MKSYNVVPGEKHIRIQVNMPHGHPPGWAPQEIGLFIDSKCRSGQALPVPGKPVVEGDHIKVACTSTPSTKLKKAELNYTADTGPRSKRKWTSIPATLSPPLLTSGGVLVQTNDITAPKPPAEANTWYISITDERDAMVSTAVQFAP